jgi:phosphoribosyl-dephospho-CoA transferase
MSDCNVCFERHRMIWVDPGMWRDVIASEPALSGEPLVAGWASAGWPVISRRAACSEEAAMAALGLPLPPAWGKGRVSLRVPPGAIVADAPAPLLKSAAQAAPVSWQATIAALLDIDENVRCFGSLAWQYLTGLEYISATSDLDLLWRVADAARATALSRQIEVVAEHAPVCIDGELIAPSADAVQWREWCNADGILLVKNAEGVRLLPRDEVFR